MKEYPLARYTNDDINVTFSDLVEAFDEYRDTFRRLTFRSAGMLTDLMSRYRGTLFGNIAAEMKLPISTFIKCCGFDSAANERLRQAKCRKRYN